MSIDIKTAVLDPTPTKTYETDGHTRTPLPEDIMIGTALRRPNRHYLEPSKSKEGLSTFSDSIVLGLWTEGTRPQDFRRSYQDGAEAMREAPKDAIVWVEIARPYLYAHSIGICFNWVQGVERYNCMLKRVLENYQVITLSTGKVDKFKLQY